VNEKLRDVSEPLAELAGLVPESGPWSLYEVPDADLVRLTATARAAGHRWAAIDNACDHGPGKDIPAVIRQLPCMDLGDRGWARGVPGMARARRFPGRARGGGA
jgi:hypothetical protein